MRVLILIQLLAGFVLAFLGVIIIFYVSEVWLGLGIALVGFYAVIRATSRETYVWSYNNTTCNRYILEYNTE